jgi:hypothetical protein
MWWKNSLLDLRLQNRLFFVLRSFLFHETATQDDDGTDDGPDAVAHN